MFIPIVTAAIVCRNSFVCNLKAPGGDGSGGLEQPRLWNADDRKNLVLGFTGLPDMMWDDDRLI